VDICIHMKRVAFAKSPASFNALLDALEQSGYVPLLRKARTGFLRTIAGERGVDLDVWDDAAAKRTYSQLQRMFYLRARPTYDNLLRSIPLIGDVFLVDESDSLLVLMLSNFISDSERRSRRDDEGSRYLLQVAYIGDPKTSHRLDPFVEDVSHAMESVDVASEWEELRLTAPGFERLADSGANYLPASVITESESACASQLEECHLRKLASKLKQSGGMLADGLSQDKNALHDLLEAGLVSREFIVVCKRDGHQIIRVTSREAIDQMASMGAQCSCGKPVNEESIKEYYTPTPLLKKLLDQSYWMSAILVSALSDVRVPKESIFLNLRQGSTEIDAFADICGDLVMFELKDSQFSMGHAYAFGGRIGEYKPDWAVIVSTSGVDKEVEQHFTRVKPECKIVYIANLADLASKTGEIATAIRTKRCGALLQQLDLIAGTGVPVSQLLAQRLGVSIEPEQGDLRFPY